jgi:hypothetical protein
LLLQVVGPVQQSGTLDVRGGDEVVVDFQDFFRLKTFGGAGGAGFLRLERPASENPALPQLGTTAPAPLPQSIGVLEEADDRVGFMTIWRSTLEQFPPTFLRYEITASVDGVNTVFSDDPAVGMPALEGTAPLIFFIQGIETNPVTGLPEDGAEPSAWRRYVGPFSNEGGLFQDGKNGFRWTLIQDRTISTDVIVQSVKIIYEA